MIFITGDTHGDLNRFRQTNFPEQKQMTKEDYVIICGDFGGIWNVDENSKSENYELDLLNKRNFTTLFVDGNHENFNRLYNYHIKEWNGGLVHEIRPSILHLMRGEIYTIENKKFFTFGGAKSQDIKDGILDPTQYSKEEFNKIYKQWNKLNKWFRVKNVSWWEQEMPSDEEYQNGLNNLNKNNWTVDFVITHCAPTSTEALISHGKYKHDELNNYLEDIHCKLNYKHWFFGHYHDNINLNASDHLIYEQIIQIA